MSTQTLILTFIVFALTGTYYAYPTTNTPIEDKDLKDVANKTICPITVEYNKDDNRVPRIIKMMKCSRDTQHYCKDQQIPENECCNNKDANHPMECVNIMDSVLVYYKNTSETQTTEVYVGCACLIGKSTKANSIPS